MALLRLELFVADLERSLDFYRRVLGFHLDHASEGGYTALSRGEAQIALNLADHLPADHPVYFGGDERPGRGVEIVLEVDDLEALYEQVQHANWPVERALQRQPWGTVDFRVQDPDGYYLRFNRRRGPEPA